MKEKLCQAIVERDTHSTGEGSINRTGLLINGNSLKHAFHKDVKHMFLDFALSCEAVVCSRTTPHQKAEIVTMVSSDMTVSVFVIIAITVHSCTMFPRS